MALIDPKRLLPLLLLLAGWLMPVGPVAAEPEVPAVLIRLDKGGRVAVLPLTSAQAQLPEGASGLVVWIEGNRERWQRVEKGGKWKMPVPDEDATEPSPGGGATRSLGGDAGTGSAVALQTTQLDQFKGVAVLRGGGLLTPSKNGALLHGKPTFRRGPAEKGKKLPAMTAIISRDRATVARIPFREGQAAVRWADVPGLPKDGLAPGTYTLSLAPGLVRADFTVESSARRSEVMKRPKELERLLGSRTHALYLQVAAEHFLAQKDKLGQPRPYLADALDILDAVPAKDLTPPLRRLREHVLKRLRDPDAVPVEVPVALGEPTGIAEIDRARGLIAAGKWVQARKALNRIKPAAGQRAQGLAALYRGEILSESGALKEDEAVTAFMEALRLLKGGEPADLYRARNNLGNFLLNRCQDLLYNHSFQMASGVQHSLFSALVNWVEAHRQYEAASSLAAKLGPSHKAAVALNLGRLHAMLADILRTLADPKDESTRFSEGEKAAAAQALLHAKQAVGTVTDSDPLLAPVAHELQAQIHLRRGDGAESLAACGKAADSALQGYLRAGSLSGVESIQRLLGLLARKQGRPAEALAHFQIAHQVAELLRERFPSDQVGLTQAGFYARRAYVNEQIIELLIGQGKDADALLYAESSKAQALQDLLATRRTDAEADRPAPRSLEEIRASWPKDVAAVEYFLGTQRAWGFLVSAGGKVRAFPLNDAKGKPVASRDLVFQVRRFLTQIEGQAPKMRARLTRGRGFDHSWQGALHGFCKTLLPDPILKELRAARTVVVVPHHILHYFPFIALVVKPDPAERSKFEMLKPTFLLDEPFDVCYAPSLLNWDLLRRPRLAPITRVGAAAIVEFADAAPLPGVAEDVKNLKEAFGDKVGTIAFGDKATLPNVRKLLGQPGLLLFATHGVNLADKPLDSFLMLTPQGKDNGRLTALEIYGMSIKPDLIVMSACYSGLADRSPLPGDDLFGLQRAFLQSGARTVVSGLWDVYDGTGPTLMKGAFERLAKGESAPRAVAQSQRAMLKKLREAKDAEPWLHPYFWAVYTVAGNDRAP